MRARTDVVVELDGLAFADASFVLDLVALARRLRARHRALRVRGAQPQIMRLMELVGFNRVAGVNVESSAALA